MNSHKGNYHHICAMHVAKCIIFLLLITIFATSYASATDSDCFSCHENVRHSLIDDDCQNCHIDDLTNGEHTDLIRSVQNVHEDFDWENDNSEESEDERRSESCSICHRSSNIGDLNVCENCHLPADSVMFTGLSSSLVVVRSDINDIIPRVYAHTNFSSIYIPDQSDLGFTKSTCFGFSLITGEGTCHGVQYQMKEKTGGYFAHNMSNSGSAKRSSPYMETNTIDNLPDTSDCKFCHLQEDPYILKVWGNAKEPSKECKTKKSSDCWNCHVTGGKRPPGFHSELIVMNAENNGSLTNLGYVVIVVIFIVSIFAYKHKKPKK